MFRETFQPKPNVDYEWVKRLAVDQFSTSFADYKALDEKASSIITWIGGGTALMVIGTITSMTKNEMTPLVAGLIGIPVVLAIAAVLFALLARYGRGLYLPPAVKTAVEYAELFGTEGETLAMGEWHLCGMLMDRNIRVRSISINRALLLGSIAVASLLLPMAVAVVQKANNTPTAMPSTTPDTIPIP